MQRPRVVALAARVKIRTGPHSYSKGENTVSPIYRQGLQFFIGSVHHKLYVFLVPKILDKDFRTITFPSPSEFYIIV